MSRLGVMVIGSSAVRWELAALAAFTNSTGSSRSCKQTSSRIFSLVDCTTPTISKVYLGENTIPDLCRSREALERTGGMLLQIQRHRTIRENSLKPGGAESL